MKKPLNAFVALALGASAWAAGGRASVFNRSGVPLRLVLQDGPRPPLLITRYDLPNLATRIYFLEGGKTDLEPLALMPEGLMTVACHAPVSGEITFEVQAEGSGPPRKAGSLTLSPDPARGGEVRLEVTLDPTFQVHARDTGADVVVRQAHPEHDALAEAEGNGTQPNTWQGVCAIQ